jgi:hypothetical protein
MKAAVRLAIILAALLVISNVAFAQDGCDQELCYDVTATDQNGDTLRDFLYVCIYNDGTGETCSDVGCGPIYLFGGGPGWFNTSGNPMFGGNPYWTSFIFAADSYSSGYAQLQGAGYPLISGEGQMMGIRFTFKGPRVSQLNCPPPG